MNQHVKSLMGSLVLLAGAAAFAQTGYAPLPSQGDTFIHDPSTVIKEGANYYVFGTGRGIRTKSSPDLIHWQAGPPVFAQAPVSVTQFAPGFTGDFWAPDIIAVNGTYYLYYAASSMGKQTSAIGLATNATLNPADANFGWHDCGPVVISTNGGPFNTIDPSVMLDNDGKLWMSFGSYWAGIFLAELNPQTGLRIATNAPLYHLAWNQSIEASCITRHDNFYYLFVNWGSCCQGTNSTYQVRMGRADKITGPYRDHDGRELTSGGGSVFLQTSGRFFGPGHIGILNDGTTNGPNWFSYHYYDADTQGRPRLAIGKIDWSTGWPVASN